MQNNHPANKDKSQPEKDCSNSNGVINHNSSSNSKREKAVCEDTKDAQRQSSQQQQQQDNKQVVIATSSSSSNNHANSGITIGSIIGEYGPYQFSLTSLAFIRYICVAMMTNTGPLIAPEVDFYCSQVPDSVLAQISKPANETWQQFLKGKCSLELVHPDDINQSNINSSSLYKCSAWIYNTSEHGETLTDKFNLVCGRDWLRSAFQSTVSVGVVVASIVWGATSDKYGRNYTIRVCFLISLLSGFVSYFAENFLLYTLSRSLCTFGDLGLVVSLSTIMVETLGSKYRGAVCIIVYTGWAVGVLIMPWITEYFNNYRQLMLFTVACHLLTLPWLITVGESVRWSLVNGKIVSAGQELKRISWWNHNNDQGSLKIVEEKFDQLKTKFVFLAEKRQLQKDVEKTTNMSISSLLGGAFKVVQLFQTRELTITTITLVWTTFNSELLYMLFILINSDIGDDVKLNYAIGGLMEGLATLISIVIISKMTRRFSLVSTLVTISSLCLVLAFTHSKPTASLWVANLAKLAISTLSSLIYVTTTEIFPTNLRQTGIGVSGTLGSFGAVVAPFIRTELVSLIGMTNVMLMFFVLPLTAALVIPFFLRETKGVELSDDVDDINGPDLGSSPSINVSEQEDPEQVRNEWRRENFV